MPPNTKSLMEFKENLNIEGVLYSVIIKRISTSKFTVELNASSIDVVVRKLGDGGILLQVLV